MEFEELRNDLAAETKRITYIIHEHDKLEKECQNKIPLLEIRANSAEAKRLKLEHDISSIMERIPASADELLITVKRVQEI